MHAEDAERPALDGRPIPKPRPVQSGRRHPTSDRLRHHDKRRTGDWWATQYSPACGPAPSSARRCACVVCTAPELADDADRALAELLHARAAA